MITYTTIQHNTTVNDTMKLHSPNSIYSTEGSLVQKHCFFFNIVGKPGSSDAHDHPFAPFSTDLAGKLDATDATDPPDTKANMSEPTHPHCGSHSLLRPCLLQMLMMAAGYMTTNAVAAIGFIIARCSLCFVCFAQTI